MIFPPVVPGVTEQSGAPDEGGGIGSLLQRLFLSRGGGSETSLAYIQHAIQLLEKAARNDPRIAPRIVKALETLETSDDESEMRGSNRGLSKMSSMFGGIQSPV